VELAGKVVIVTGASSGIGAATARLAAAERARVVLAARRTDRIQALAAELPGALAVTTDMRDPEQVRALVRTAIDHFGRVDVLVNNAGQGLHVPLEEVDLQDLEAITELNVYGPLVAMQAVLPAMRSQGGGAIVNVSSGTSRFVVPGLGAYAATKCALNMLSEIARKEFAPDGIVVSLIYPSITDTEFHQTLRAGSFESGRFTELSAEEVAEAIVGLIQSGEAEADLTPRAGG
jgi:NADP-dependent 3-hydroxy acid dehydrogenase YdfG